jgi:hypothetical protein
MLGGTNDAVYDDRGDIMAMARPAEEDRLLFFFGSTPPSFSW